jgi:hypothetical protein
VVLPTIISCFAEGMSMAQRVSPGEWARIHVEILPAGERAAGIPPDTAAHPYEAWINGFAQQEAALGEAVTIRTLSGRCVQGTLVEIDPGYSHGFGRPHGSLLAVGPSLKRLLDATEE